MSPQHLLQSTFYRNTMSASIVAYRDLNPGAIWSMSANGHGRLSTIALWSAFPDLVTVFHLNLWRSGSGAEQAIVVNETKAFLLGLQIDPTFVLHDGQLFDLNEPRQALPFQHMMQRICNFFSTTDLIKTYGPMFPPLIRPLWGCGIHRDALNETVLTATFEVFDQTFSDRIRYPHRYLLSQAPGLPTLFDANAEARLLAATDRHTPIPKEPCLNGLPAPYNLSGMFQTTSDIFNLIRLLWARKTAPVTPGNTDQLREVTSFHSSIYVLPHSFSF